MAEGRPRIAIVDPNTLATIGLKQLLQSVMPIMSVDTFGSFAELVANGPENYFHFFVSMNLVLENRSFFLEYRRKTIVLTMSNDPSTQMKDFHSICINVPEGELVRSLLMLEQHAHAEGRNLPPMPRALQAKVLTDREIEVLRAGSPSPLLTSPRTNMFTDAGRCARYLALLRMSRNLRPP